MSSAIAVIVNSAFSRSWLSVRIRDFTQGSQRVLELPGPGPAQVSLPGGLDATDNRDADLDELVSLRGQGDEPGAGVAGVGDALDVSRTLELIDDGTHRLLADLRCLGEFGEPGTFRGDALEHAGLVERDVMPVRLQCGHHGRLHEAVRDEQQEAEIEFAWIVCHLTMIAEVRDSD